VLSRVRAVGNGVTRTGTLGRCAMLDRQKMYPQRLVAHPDVQRPASARAETRRGIGVDAGRASAEVLRRDELAVRRSWVNRPRASSTAMSRDSADAEFEGTPMVEAPRGAVTCCRPLTSNSAWECPYRSIEERPFASGPLGVASYGCRYWIDGSGALGTVLEEPWFTSKVVLRSTCLSMMCVTSSPLIDPDGARIRMGSPPHD
jgi:hypothetical protein